ncbi:MAG: 23S rRNA (guanosine(2251)-2'-O)-methyltransferase RlmB [Candidatus Kapaibacteriota bacterium]|jgi:23S rRNA (guanosine2251-2'-O)-methyltransferase
MEQNSLIFGRNPVLEALRNRPESIEKIYIRYGTKGKAIDNIFHLARKFKIPVSTLDKEKYLRLVKQSEFPDTQGVVAILSVVNYVELTTLVRNAFESTRKPIFVLLDRIQDPQNLGAIARTAECSGVQGIILTSEDSAPITPSVVKASSGAILNIPIAKVKSLSITIEFLKENGFWVIGTDSNAKSVYWETNYDFALAIVIGNEGKGISSSILNKCDVVVKIPLFGKTSSLNASVSAGIILYEVLRQRGLPGSRLHPK